MRVIRYRVDQPLQSPRLECVHGAKWPPAAVPGAVQQDERLGLLGAVPASSVAQPAVPTPAIAAAVTDKKVRLESSGPLTRPDRLSGRTRQTSLSRSIPLDPPSQSVCLIRTQVEAVDPSRCRAW